MSWSVALFALLASTCMTVGDAYDMYGGMYGGGMYGGYGGMGAATPYYPSPQFGMDMGFMGSPDFLDDRSSGEPELLNCYASYLTPDGRGVASEMAVTIEQKQDTGSDWDHGMGIGMGIGMGMGYGLGDHKQSSGPGLSARVELINNVEGGKGYIVFTKTARFNDACGEGRMTDVLVNRRNSMGGQAMGGHGMGGYGMAGHGMGGYGMGGYGMGYGMDLGMVGYGMGFGMGHGAQSMFDSEDQGEGIVAEINVTPGAMTSAVIDDIGFTDLNQLAGRGVLICSSVDYDWDWNPTCEEPFYSCCNLKYDREGLTITNNAI